MFKIKKPRVGITLACLSALGFGYQGYNQSSTIDNIKATFRVMAESNAQLVEKLQKEYPSQQGQKIFYVAPLGNEKFQQISTINEETIGSIVTIYSTLHAPFAPAGAQPMTLEEAKTACTTSNAQLQKKLIEASAERVLPRFASDTTPLTDFRNASVSYLQEVQQTYTSVLGPIEEDSQCFVDNISPEGEIITLKIAQEKIGQLPFIHTYIPGMGPVHTFACMDAMTALEQRSAELNQKALPLIQTHPKDPLSAQFEQIVEPKYPQALKLYAEISRFDPYNQKQVNLAENIAYYTKNQPPKFVPTTKAIDGSHTTILYDGNPYGQACLVRTATPEDRSPMAGKEALALCKKINKGTLEAIVRTLYTNPNGGQSAPYFQIAPSKGTPYEVGSLERTMFDTEVPPSAHHL
ncbi:MAG: hypothetical protein AB7E52_07375 [Bdellovibrionales bacterium]